MKTYAYLWLVLTALVLVGLPAVVSASRPASTNIYFDLAIDDSRQRLYGSDRNSGTIHVISMSTFDVISTVTVGSQPTGLDISPNSNELAVALYGQGEIAFIDLQALSVISRVVPLGTFGPNQPYDVVYGRPGRLYSVGNPDSAGFDYVHVFDTNTKLEIGRSTEIMRAAPRLAMTVDQNTLYVSQVSFSPQKIYRFDITTDTPSQTAEAPHGPVSVNTLCVMSGGTVYTSYGQVWSGDLSTLLGTFPASGNEIECVKSLQRIYISSGSDLTAIDANTNSKLFDFNFGDTVGVARVNKAESILYVSTSGGVEALRTAFRPRLYLPLISQPRPGISGRVTLNGVPAAGIQLDLRFYNGATWSSLASTYTQADGGYAFTNAPSLGSGQLYYVRYQNTTGPGRLWTWHTQVLTAYTAGGTVHIGDFDIADIGLLSPANNAAVSLPRTFQWSPRSATPSDTYEFDLYEPNTGNPYFYTAPPLGYVGSYTLNTLPAGFKVGRSYVWEVWVYSPDGGYGISYESRLISFTNKGTPVQPSTANDGVPLLTQRRAQSPLDFEMRPVVEQRQR